MGRAQSTRLEEQLAAVDAELRKIKGAERIVAIDPATGKVTLDTGADGFSITLTHSDDVAMTGTVVTHNHPRGLEEAPGTVKYNGSAFSPEDLATGWRAGVAEMRVVTPTSTYTLKNKSDESWGQVTAMTDTRRNDKARAIDQSRELDIQEINSRVETAMWQHINAGVITPTQAAAVHNEVLLDASAKKFGWEYTIERHAGYTDPGVTAADVSSPSLTQGTPWLGDRILIELGLPIPDRRHPRQTVVETIADLAERVRLLEHPGHGDQKVHGRRGGVDVSGSELANISAKTRAKMLARAEAIGMPSVKQMAASIGRAHKKATPDQVERGMEWYDDAHKGSLALVNKKATFEQTTAVMALNSPTRHWDVNKAVTIELVGIVSRDRPFHVSKELGSSARPPIKEGTYKPSDLNASQVGWTHPRLQRDALKAEYSLSTDAMKGFGKNHNAQMETSVRVLRGELTPDQALTGVKVRNFYNNIYDPRAGGVTVDDWAYKAALPKMQVTVRYSVKVDGVSTQRTYTGDAAGAPYGTLGQFFGSSPKAKGEGYSAGLYPLVAEAYSIAAKKAGTTPSQMQAIVWNQIRESE